MDRDAIVAAVYRAGYGARAARIERCPPRFDPFRPACGDRLCRRCGRRWVRRQLARLRAYIPEGAVMVMATVKGVGSTTSTAARAFRAAWQRFRRIARRHGWIPVGARHLARAKGDAWIDHAHVIVAASQGDRASLTATVRAAGAWSDPDPIESIERVLRYALRGARRPPCAEHLPAWIAATIGRPTIIAPRSSRRTDKRNRATATPSATPADRARASILRQLHRRPPRSASDLWAGLTSALRATLRATPTAYPSLLATMERAGEIVQVAGRRGTRWTLASREAA